MSNAFFEAGYAQGVKLARDMPSFLRQDRPAAVKKIYRALKREHPRMPAEMKARIASRQGRPGTQKQGPPYSGPVTKSAGLVPKKALVAAGALAVPYAVGRKVQNQQQEQVMNKSAAFNIGVVDGMSKEALSPALRNRALGMRMARTFREYGGKGGFLSSNLYPSNLKPAMEVAKSVVDPSPAMRRYLRANARDLHAAHQAGDKPGVIGAMLHASANQTKGWAKELAKKK